MNQPIEKIIAFPDNRFLPQLYGVARKHLSDLERLLAIDIIDRGTQLTLRGDKKNILLAEEVLHGIYQQVAHQKPTRAHGGSPPLTAEDITAMMKGIITNGIDTDSFIAVRHKKIQLRTPHQRQFIRLMKEKDLTFGIGVAGTGKTFLAVAFGFSLLTTGAVEKIIITRPVVEAGENLGFLPGDLTEKIDPYLRPIDDAATEIIGLEKMKKYKESGQVEIAPLAYMRGRTLKNAFILLDEAQNAKKMQMKMFLTRLGEHSKMVITGDGSQTDLGRRDDSGLIDAMNRLSHLPDIGVARFDIGDIQRHSLVSKIIAAYDDSDKK
ncbi:MAG: PhoH family protein [Alphaproteobacteria bacterium]|nr:PhoH family protein [Alphaproteobacteria bacterium]